MGLLFTDEGSLDLKRSQETALLHRLGCKVCPLREEPGDMAATGAAHPLIYCLGEAPGRQEIEQREQFVGESGQLLRPRLPKHIRSKIRWNNTVRSRPPRNRTPVEREIECCRPSIVKDIEASAPAAIFGFGNVPLNWVSGFSGITLWRGRRMPVLVGKHACWYYPMLHPAYVLRLRRGREMKDTDIGSEEERMFCFDLERAIAEVGAGLPRPEVHTPEMARAGVECVTEGGDVGLERIAKALKRVVGKPHAPALIPVGLDYETNCLRPFEANAKILTAAISTGHWSLAFPIDHPQSPFTAEQRDIIVRLWTEFLGAVKGPKVVHSLAFELEWTGVMFGEELIRTGRWEDTMTQASLLDERRGKQKPGCFSLEFLVQQHFGFNLKKLSGVNRKALANERLQKVLSYNGMDSKYHTLLWRKQTAQLAEDGLTQTYALALRRIPTLTLSQIRGVPVDPAAVALLRKKYSKRIARLEKEIAALPISREFERRYGEQFNPHSNPHVLHIFWDMLECPECRVKDKYKKGEYKFSCDESVLEQIEHPLAALLIQLRKANKRKSNYIDTLTEGSDTLYPDGLVHAHFNSTWVETGRLSAEGPNLQNWPKREEEAKEVRRPIVAARNCVILAFDYGQIEARVIAMFTKDRAFCKALWDRYDIHADWAEQLAKAYPQRIGGRKLLTDKKAMKDFRTDIKNQWTFPLVYGAQLESAAGYLNIPDSVLRPYYHAFWRQFAGIKEWQERQLEFYREYGYVECLTKRRRRGPLSVNKIYNSPIQGTAAEIVMDGMCRLSETGDPEIQPEINVHDDLTFLRVEERRQYDVAEKVLNVLLDVRHFPWINVPITVELAIGKNWMPYDEKINPEGLKEFGTFASDTWRK